MDDYRIGNGYDVHRLVSGRKLFLGCVEIPHSCGLLGHSDADVLCHAIADALLGAACLGDIGVHFPDSEDKFRGVSGSFILIETRKLCEMAGFCPVNIDAVVIAEKPKLMPFIPQMKERIAEALSILPNSVNIKATTEEGLGFTGREEGIAATAVCLLKKKR